MSDTRTNRRGFFLAMGGVIAIAPVAKMITGLNERDWWDVSDIRAAYRRNLGREATDAEIYNWLMPPSVRQARRAKMAMQSSGQFPQLNTPRIKGGKKSGTKAPKKGRGC